MNCVEKIIQLMEEKNINNFTMEKIAGIYNGSINTWKKGKAKPSLDALIKIADYFGVSLDYLVGREEKSINATQQERISVSSNANEMLTTFNQLSNDSQIMCIGFAEQMLRHETEKQSKSNKNNAKRQKSV